MASITHDGGGFRRIEFNFNGKPPENLTGQNVGDHVRARRSSGTSRKSSRRRRSAGRWRMKRCKWLCGVDDVLHGKLADKALVQPRSATTDSTLGPFIDRYVERRTDVKPASKEVWRQGKLGLIEFFGAERRIATITPGMADDYKQKLIATMKKSRAQNPATKSHRRKTMLASMTVRKRLQFAKMIFRAAVRHQADRFESVRRRWHRRRRCPIGSGSSRRTKPKSCSRPVRRAKIGGSIIALSRYGGMRCPSEVLSLKLGRRRLGKQTASSLRARRRPITLAKKPGPFRCSPNCVSELLRAAEVDAGGSGLRGRRAIPQKRHRPPGLAKLQSADDVREDHQASRPDAVAAAVSQSAIEPANRTAEAIPVARRLRLAGQFAGHRPRALLASHRHPFRAGDRQRAAESDAPSSKQLHRQPAAT